MPAASLQVLLPRLRLAKAKMKAPFSPFTGRRSRQGDEGQRERRLQANGGLEFVRRVIAGDVSFSRTDVLWRR